MGKLRKESGTHDGAEKVSCIFVVVVVVAETARNRRNQIKGVLLSLHSNALRPRQTTLQENANDAIFSI